MNQQFPPAPGVAIEHIALPVRSDIDIHQEQLAVFHHRITTVQGCPAFPQRLDFGAGECDARLQFFVNRIIPQRLAIGRYYLHGLIIKATADVSIIFTGRVPIGKTILSDLTELIIQSIVKTIALYRAGGFF